MKKLIAAALITMITIGVLAGCGNTAGGNTNKPTDSTVLDTSENTAVPAAGDALSSNTQNTAGETNSNNEPGTAENSTENRKNKDQDSADIGSSEASRIALEDAGLAESEVTNLHVSKDYDDGRTVYEVEFMNDSTKYDYEILASSGEIISFDQDMKYKNSQNGVNNKSGTSNKSGAANKSGTDNTQADTQISLEDATQLALERVPGASEQNLKIELDYDDGYYKYEGEIIYDQKEYEFEIDADTGTFLEWSEERW